MATSDRELVRDLVDAVFSRRDWAHALRHLHPDAEWHNTGAFPGPEVCKGPDEIAAFWRTFLDSFEESGTSEVEEVQRRGDTVVARIHSRGQGRASGIPFDVRWAMTFRIEDGKVVRIDARGDYGKALRAAERD